MTDPRRIPHLSPEEDGKPVVIYLFPGLSIMERHWLSAGMLFVRCPGCGASLLYSTADPPTTFVHEDDDCPILRRIEGAIAMFEAMVGGWE